MELKEPAIFSIAQECDATTDATCTTARPINFLLSCFKNLLIVH